MSNNSKQETDTPIGCIEVKRQTSDLRLRWSWVEPSVWTENMLTALGNGVKGGNNSYFADLGLFSMVDARNLEIACQPRCGNSQLESRMR